MPALSKFVARSALLLALGLTVAATGCRREGPAQQNAEATPSRAEPQVTAAATPESESSLEEVTPGRFASERRVLNRADFEQVSAPVDLDTLSRAIEVRGYQAERESIGDLLEVRLDVYNVQEDRHLDFEIRTLFFREDDQLIDATPWARGTAPPRRAFRYRSVAYSPRAVSELVQLRFPGQPDALPLPGAGTETSP